MNEMIPDDGASVRKSTPPVLVVLGCLIYVLSPIDFVPEALLGPLGLFDDGAAIIMAFNALRDAMKPAANLTGTKDL